MKAKDARERGDLNEYIERMPHAHREFWFQRHKRALYLCVGVEEFWETCNADFSYLFDRMIKVFRSHSLGEATTHVQNYLRFSKIP